MEAKKSYTSPELSEWGTVADLTQAGFTTAGQDCFGGSVFPPGHDPNCSGGPPRG